MTFECIDAAIWKDKREEVKEKIKNLYDNNAVQAILQEARDERKNNKTSDLIKRMNKQITKIEDNNREWLNVKWYQPKKKQEIYKNIFLSYEGLKELIRDADEEAYQLIATLDFVTHASQIAARQYRKKR